MNALYEDIVNTQNKGIPFKYCNPDGFQYYDPQTHTFSEKFSHAQQMVLRQIMEEKGDAGLVAYPFISADRMLALAEFMEEKWKWEKMEFSRKKDGLLWVGDTRMDVWRAGQVDLNCDTTRWLLCVCGRGIRVFERCLDVTAPTELTWNMYAVIVNNYGNHGSWFHIPDLIPMMNRYIRSGNIQGLEKKMSKIYDQHRRRRRFFNFVTRVTASEHDYSADEIRDLMYVEG